VGVSHKNIIWKNFQQGEKMENIKSLNKIFSKTADAVLLIWWGVVMLVNPLTLAIGAIGSGLILLGVNAARLWKGIPTKPATTAIGVTTLVWGILDTIFDPRFEMSFAILLIVIGVVSLISLLAKRKTESPS
jgi:hypothetical protein